MTEFDIKKFCDNFDGLTFKEKLKELDCLSYELDETRDRICDEYMSAMRQNVSEAIHAFVKENTLDEKVEAIKDDYGNEYYIITNGGLTYNLLLFFVIDEGDWMITLQIDDSVMKTNQKTALLAEAAKNTGIDFQRSDDDCIEIEVPEEKLILMTEEIIEELSKTHF